MGFSTTFPTPNTKLKNIPPLFTQNWQAIDGALSYEHFSLAATAEQSRHYPGITGFMLSTPTSALTGISPASGALVFDTTQGQGKVFAVTASAWQLLSYDLSMSRVSVYLSGSTLLGAGNYYQVPFNTKIIDQFSEYTISTQTFSATSPGYYLISAQVCVSGTGGDAITWNIQVVDSSFNTTALVVDTHTLESSDFFTRPLNLLAFMDTSHSAFCTFNNFTTNTKLLSGGANLSFLNIYRLS